VWGCLGQSSESFQFGQQPDTLNWMCVTANILATAVTAQHTVYIIKIELKAIILLNVADLFHKNVIIFHRDPEPHYVFVPFWHESECAGTVEAGLLQ
jgi:hypothetical protein